MSQGKRVTQRSQLHELVMARKQWRMSDHLRTSAGDAQGEGRQEKDLHANPGHEADVVDSRVLDDVVDGAAQGQRLRRHPGISKGTA